jgi:glutaredoxin
MATTGRNTLFYIKRFFGALLLLSLAAVFFISAISKLQSLEAFEWTFLDMGIKSTTSASVFAHLFIGLEFMVGSFLLLHIYLRQVTYPITIGILVLLTGYLILLMIQQGNTGNCGCFGDWVYMNPLQAIWKNLAMIAACVLLVFIYPVKPYRNQEALSAIVAMLALVAPFIVSPVNTNNQPALKNKAIDLSSLYENNSSKPVVELREGKHIVAFMSLTCPHCKKAAYLLHTIKLHNKTFPIYIVLNGNPDNAKEFFKESHAEDVPHILFTNTDAFLEMAGPSVPAIYWINNSIIELESNYYQLDPAFMARWLKN